MQEHTREPFWIRCGETTARDLRNSIQTALILLAWALCFAGTSQLIKRELLPSGPIVWLVALIPSIVGVLVIVAYARFLREADELQRMIQLQSLALGFGGAFFAISGYSIFERLGAPPADIADFMIVMAILYAIGSVLGWRRYH